MTAHADCKYADTGEPGGAPALLCTPTASSGSLDTYYKGHKHYTAPNAGRLFVSSIAAPGLG